MREFFARKAVIISIDQYFVGAYSYSVRRRTTCRLPTVPECLSFYLRLSCNQGVTSLHVSPPCRSETTYDQLEARLLPQVAQDMSMAQTYPLATGRRPRKPFLNMLIIALKTP